MKTTKLLTLLMAVVIIVASLSACTAPVIDSSSGTSTPTPGQTAPADAKPADDKPSDKKLEPITFTMFVAGPGEAPPKDNKVVKNFKKSQASPSILNFS